MSRIEHVGDSGNISIEDDRNSDYGPVDQADVDRVKEVLDALTDTERQLLEKGGFKKVRFRDLPIEDTGLTPDCPDENYGDINLNKGNLGDIKRTLNHEIGHAIDELLGEFLSNLLLWNALTFVLQPIASKALVPFFRYGHMNPLRLQHRR